MHATRQPNKLSTARWCRCRQSCMCGARGTTVFCSSNDLSLDTFTPNICAEAMFQSVWRSAKLMVRMWQPGGHSTVRHNWVSQTHGVKVTHCQSYKLLQFVGLWVPCNRLSRVRSHIATPYTLHQCFSTFSTSRYPWPRSSYLTVPLQENIYFFKLIYVLIISYLRDITVYCCWVSIYSLINDVKMNVI